MDMELYDWQRDAIDELMRGSGRVLVVAPTGGGKSMCYQQPAVELPGTALVITPLVALMADQVSALEARGVAATYLASNLPADEVRRREQAALDGRFRLLYVAPERLASDRFVDEVLGRLEISLLAVDEAHCISHWGHDFRPDYLQIGALVARLRPSRIVACTATATPAVRQEIVERLGMPDALQVLRGFARRNLELSVVEASGNKTKETQIAAEVKRALGKPGSGAGTAIVYTSQRRHAEEVAAALRNAGWRADHYHAGMEGPARTLVQSRFQAGTLDVVAATNAFGMGIDRPDIRLVVHHALPESVEAYYQEVGRAGRDGEPARGVLLLSDPDIAWRFGLIAGEALDAELALRRRDMLRAMVGYAETSECRHDTILRYFEDEAEALGGCGHCDNCRARAGGHLTDEPDESTSADVVRRTLAAIRALPFAVGAGAIASYLLGDANAASVKKYEWGGRAGFGTLADANEAWIKRLLRRLLAGGMLALGNERATLHLTRRGADVASGARENPVRLPPKRLAGTAARRAGDKAAPPAESELDGNALALFGRLRAWRLALAEKHDVPVYTVFADATLRAIAETQPDDDEALLAIPGIGPTKLERHGADLLAMVRAHVASHGARTPRSAATPCEPRPSYHEERVAEARKVHPRAFERWDDAEDARLRTLADAGRDTAAIAAELQRQPGAIAMRAQRLGVELVDAAVATT